MGDVNTNAELAAFGWPPLLPTPRAVAYTGVSRWALMRAVRSGALVPAGRRARTYIFARADLDRWLCNLAPSPMAKVIAFPGDDDGRGSR